MNYIEIMQKREPYVCNYIDMPKHMQTKARRLVMEYDNIDEELIEERRAILKELFGTYNEMAMPAPGFKCDYGFNIHFGGLAVVNFNVVMLDTSPIDIGAGAFIGPGTCFACASHAMIGEQRTEGVGSSSPIKLEENVWIGANVTVCGGVTIGKGSVIGAGSVVNKDIPAGVVAAGVPCRVIREITDDDYIDF